LDGGGRIVPTVAGKAGGGSARIAELDRALGRLARPVVERLPRRVRRAAERIERRPGGAGQLAAAGFLLASVLYGLVAGGQIGGVVDSALVFLGLGIQTVEVSGDAATPQEAILGKLQPKGSLLNFDIESAQNRIEELPWIAGAKIRKFFPNTLSVDVSERTPFALWQRDGQVYVIDKDGREIEPLQDQRYGKLPFTVGDEANHAAADLLAQIDAQPAIAERLQSAVFVAARRWDLHLDDGLTVKLPEHDVGPALAELVQLDAEKQLLSRDVVVIDLRLPDRVTVRLPEGRSLQDVISDGRPLKGKPGKTRT
jgi:cell division protein FtsQ